MADNSILDLPDSDWTIACLVKATDGNSQSSSFSRLMSRNDNGSTGIFGFGITSGGIGTAFDDLTLSMVDNDGSSFSQTSTANPFASNTSWTSVVIVRSSTTVTAYVNNSSVASGTAIDAVGSDDTGTLAGQWVFLNREQANRGSKVAMAECAKWDRALDSNERAALWNNGAQTGASANSIATPVWYVPMYSGDYTEKIAGLSVTNSNTAGTTHPTVAYPLTMPLLSVAPTLHAPTFAATYSLAMPVLSVAPTFYDHEFVQDEATLEPPLLDNAVTFFNPTFAPGSVNASPPLLSVPATLYNPAFAATYALAMPLLSVTATLYAPTFYATYAVTAPLLSVAPTLYNATFAATYALQPPLLDVTPTLYSHSFPGQDITVVMPLLSVPPAFMAHLFREKWSNVDSVTPGTWTDTDHTYEVLG